MCAMQAAQKCFGPSNLEGNDREMGWWDCCASISSENILEVLKDFIDRLMCLQHFFGAVQNM